MISAPRWMYSSARAGSIAASSTGHQRVEVAAERDVANDVADAAIALVAGTTGTLRSVTERARPSSTATRASTSPAGVSSRTTVSGSRTSTMPVSTSTVATPIVPCPHIGRQPLTPR